MKLFFILSEIHYVSVYKALKIHFWLKDAEVMLLFFWRRNSYLKNRKKFYSYFYKKNWIFYQEDDLNSQIFI